jgi:hypothetical protein
VPGELCLGGAGLGPGDRDRPELDGRFVADPFARGERLFRTGDRARLLADGTFVFLGSGRLHLRGTRVEPGEIAIALARLPAVAEATVLLCPDSAGEPRLVAYVVPRPGQASTDTELRQQLRRTLPRPLVPQLFVELEQLPRGPDGAVDPARLPSPFGSSATMVEPRTPAERQLAELWGQALGVAQVSIYDNFFDLGGHSLLCFQVIAELEKRTGTRLPPRALLLNSLEQVAAQLGTGAPAPATEAPRAPLGSRMMQRLRAMVGGRPAGES